MKKSYLVLLVVLLALATSCGGKATPAPGPAGEETPGGAAVATPTPIQIVPTPTPKPLPPTPTPIPTPTPAPTPTAGGAEAPAETPTEPPPVPEMMVEIPAGEFTMGNDTGDDDEKPAHTVTLEAFEIDMTAKRDMANPYTDALPDKGDAYVKVTFTCQSGQARGKTVTIAGFWDGGNDWKVRFAPPAAGKWSYKSVSEDKGLDGVTGTVTCTEWTDAEKDRNPARRGPVRVCTSGDRAGR